MTVAVKCALIAMVSLVGATTPAFAQQSDAERQLMLKLMQETKIIAVMDVADPDKFVDDKKPDTLQIVMLHDPKFGKSRISADGEVIFDNGSSNDEQQQLFIKAFEIRARLRLAKP